MRKLNLIVLFLNALVTSNNFAQPNLPPKVADSLWQVWQDKTQPDTNRLNAMKKYAWDGYLFTKPDTAFYYAQLQYNFAKSKGLKKHMAAALNTQGVSFDIKCNYTKAIEYYTNTLKIREDIGDKNGIATSLNNVGIIYYKQGDYTKAIEYYTRSLKIKEETGDKKGIAISLNNIGIIYFRQADYAKAIEYYTNSLKINEELGDKKDIAHALINIGLIYFNQGEYTKAIEYYTNTLKIREEIGDKKGIAYSLLHFGLIYFNQGNYTKAIECYTNCLKIYEEIGDKIGIASSLINIGNTYKDQGNYTKAIGYITRALSLATEIGAVQETRQAAMSLWQINKKTGNYSDALEMHELYIKMRDSVQNEETYKATLQQSFKYEQEKKATADSIKSAEEKKVYQANLEVEKTKTEAQKRQNYFLYVGLGLVALFGLFMFNRFRVTQKQKKVIEEKEKETSEQKLIIEEKHREITDSINYAERIQRSLLASKQMLDENLGDYFVFFKPKDVVSGDFYWASSLKNNQFALMTADSTGHGVPGAIMSILNIACLNEAVKEGYKLPNEILNRTRKEVINVLKRDGSAEGGKDGMDCSLLVFNKEKNVLQIAAANNPVWIVRASTSLSPQKGTGTLSEAEVPQVIEIKPDKMPVGKHDKQDIPFTLHEVQLQKGDVIYTLTDGFPDQFGGEKGKKFMSKNLRELLATNAHLPMHEQKQLLETTFANWKKDVEQVDDVTVIGVRV